MHTLMCSNYKAIGEIEAWSVNHLTGTKVQGPVSSEASILLANTIVLGGIGCAAIGKGMTLEIELQMLVIAVVSFALLEIGVQKVHNYYRYVTQFHKVIENEWGRIFFIAFSLVRFIVLVLQGIILVIWMTTMNNIGSSSQYLFRAIFGMTCVYYGIRFIILIMEILEQSVLASSYAEGKSLGHAEQLNSAAVPLAHRKTREAWRFCMEMANFSVEFIWGALLFFIIISVIFSMTIRPIPHRKIGIRKCAEFVRGECAFIRGGFSPLFWFQEIFWTHLSQISKI